MAQPIQVSPIQVSDRDGLEYLGQSIISIIKAKEARESALRNSILKQKQNNQKIFGDANELLRDYNDKAASMPYQQRDEIFGQGVKLLSQYANDPNFPQIAQQIVANAYKSYSGWNDYFNKTNDAAKELANKYGMDEKAIKSFALKNIYDYSGDKISVNEKAPIGSRDYYKTQKGQMVLKDPSSFGDVYSQINEEVTSHPELYVDQYKLTNGAYKDLDNLVGKPQSKGSKLSLDPTGTKTTSLGTKYSISMFDKEEEKTDPVTGLKYSMPALDEQDYTQLTKPSGGFYKVLSDDKYDMLTSSESPMIKQKIMVGAINKMRDHNAEAFKKAGMKNPEDLALSVSKNNASQFESVPGFVNPFDDANLDVFQRSYAADFLKSSGRYNQDGSVMDFDIDRGVKAARPRAPKEKKQPKNADYIKAYKEIFDISKADADRKEAFTPLMDLPDFAQNVALEEAKKSLGNKISMSDVNITMSGNDVWLTTASDILDDEDNVKMAKGTKFKKLTSVGVDVKANQPMGQKAKQAAAEQKAQPKKKIYNPNTGKYE